MASCRSGINSLAQDGSGVPVGLVNSMGLEGFGFARDVTDAESQDCDSYQLEVLHHPTSTPGTGRAWWGRENGYTSMASGSLNSQEWGSEVLTSPLSLTHSGQ